MPYKDSLSRKEILKNLQVRQKLQAVYLFLEDLTADEQVRNVGYEVHILPKSGDSFFRAISLQLPKIARPQMTVNEIRELIRSTVQHGFQPTKDIPDIDMNDFMIFVSQEYLFNAQWVPAILELLAEHKIYVAVYKDYACPERYYEDHFHDVDKTIMIIEDKGSETYHSTKKSNGCSKYSNVL